MNLFRKHKKFEDQLKEQLGNSEYKPSESLWDRIDSGIAEDGFESGVQRNLENFEQVPYPETWEKIAAELPDEKISNNFLKYYGIGFTSLVLLTGAYLGFRVAQQPDRVNSRQETVLTLNNPVQEKSTPVIPGSDAVQPQTGIVKASAEEEEFKTAEANNNKIPGGIKQTPQPSPQGSIAVKPAESDIMASLQKVSQADSRKSDKKAAVTNQSDRTVPSDESRTGSLPEKSLPRTSIIPFTSDKNSGRIPANNITKQPIHRGSEHIPSAAETTGKTGSNKTKGPENASTIKQATTESAGKVNSGNSVSEASTPATDIPLTTNPSSGSSETGNMDTGSPDNNINITGGPIGSGAGSPAIAATAPVVQPEVVLPVQEDVRVLAEAKPDSIVPRYEPVDEQEKLSPVSISIITGAHMCFTTYEAPANFASRFEKNIALRKKLERPDIDWSGAFLLDIRMTERWMLSSGIMMTNFAQKFDYNTTPAVNPGNSNEPGASVNNPNDSVVTGSTYTNRIRYSWTEIPLLINYTVINGRKFNFDVQGGISFAFINTVDAGIVANDNKGVLAVKDKEAFPQISNTTFISLLPQVSYRFNEQVSLGLVPSFKYSLTSIIGNERWIQQHPYFLGLNVCLRKRF